MFLLRRPRHNNLTPSTQQQQGRGNKLRGSFRPQLEPLEDRCVPATLVVNTTDDTPAVNPAVGPLDSGGNISLRSAIERDNILGSGTIQFAIPPAGPHTITLASNLPQISSALTIQGPSPGPGLITIDGNSQFKPFNVADGANLTLSDLIIQNGQDVNGGAIEIHKTTVASNTFLTTTDVLFINNAAIGSASGGLGGAIYATGGQLAVIPVTLTDTAFNANSADAANNNPGFGGALALQFVSLQVSGGTFFNDDARGPSSGGGAIAFLAPGAVLGVPLSDSATISVTTFDSNNDFGANPTGGALFIASPGIYTVTRSTFSFNSANGPGNGFGGAVAVISASGASVTLHEDTFVGNFVSHGDSAGFAQGGALAVRTPTILTATDSISIVNVTVADNSADEGGGLYFGENGATRVTLQNSIVATNRANQDAPDMNSDNTTVVNADHSLVGDPTNSGVTATLANGNLVGTAGTPLDPRFDTAGLGFHGGLTPTLLLLPGSPAIDTGSNADNQTTDTNANFIDQRGLPRRLDGDSDYDTQVTDMGAVEIGAITTLDTSPRVLTVPPQGQIIPYTAILSNQGMDLGRSGSNDGEAVFNALIDPNTHQVGTIKATPIAVDRTILIFNPDQPATFDAVGAAVNPDGNGPVTLVSFSRVPQDSTIVGTLTASAGVFTYNAPASQFGQDASSIRSRTATASPASCQVM